MTPILTIVAWALVVVGAFGAGLLAINVLNWLIDELPAVVAFLLICGVSWAVHYLGFF